MWDVFICYAREDRTVAKRLYDDLKGTGVTPWMDTEDLLPGQNWKVIIPQVLRESSYVLVLLSSHSVSKRGFVQKELKKALDILDEFSPYDIFVIPVRLDERQPADERLQNLHWVDLFPSYETGLNQILRVLVPDSRARQATDRQAAAQPSLTMETHSTTQRRNALEKECELLNEKIAHLRKAKILETDAAVTFKLTKQLEELEHQRERLEREIASVVAKEQTKPPSTVPAPSEGKPELQQEAKPKSKKKPSWKVQKPSIISLRSEPLTVSEKEFQEVFKLDENKHPLEYIKNTYEDQDEVVVDHTTGLMWQKMGSDERLTYKGAQKYVKELNQRKFVGYDDWRLPTIPELLSLLEPEKQSNDLYINSIFDATQRWCWSTDEVVGLSGAAAWGVLFNSTYVRWGYRRLTYYVRAVRSCRPEDKSEFEKKSQESKPTVNHRKKEGKPSRKTKKTHMWTKVMLVIGGIILLEVGAKVLYRVLFPPEKITVVSWSKEPPEESAQQAFELSENWWTLNYTENNFEEQGEVVVDHATGLMWQKSGTETYMSYPERYVEKLNRQKFAGYNDWRLPTVPELMSLLEPEKQSNNLYINPIFDTTRQTEWYGCWSADHDSFGTPWYVDFSSGHARGDPPAGRFYYVRCVRSLSNTPTGKLGTPSPVTPKENEERYPGQGQKKTFHQVFFRGTPNNWGTTAMNLVADYTWEITVTVGNTSDERFKFNLHDDWSNHNYGDNFPQDGIADQNGADIPITEGAGTYTITFYDQTNAYTVVKN